MNWGSHDHLKPPSQMKARLNRLQALPWITEVLSRDMGSDKPPPKVSKGPQEGTRHTLFVRLPGKAWSLRVQLRTTASTSEHLSFVANQVAAAVGAKDPKL